MSLYFAIPGAAAPQGSKRHLGNGILVESSKRVKPWRTDVRGCAQAAMGRRSLYEGPVRVAVEFYFARPASHYRSDGESLSAAGGRAPYPLSRGDLDKLCRALLDAMTDVVFRDDRQVVQLEATKGWGENLTQVFVWPVELVERGAA